MFSKYTVLSMGIHNQLCDLLKFWAIPVSSLTKDNDKKVTNFIF